MMETTRRTFLAGAAVASLPVTAVAASKPAQKFDLQNWLDTTDVENVIDYHLDRLVKALNRADPSWLYRAEARRECGLVAVIGDKKDA